jgi:hypothetical protein
MNSDRNQVVDRPDVELEAVALECTAVVRRDLPRFRAVVQRLRYLDPPAPREPAPMTEGLHGVDATVPGLSVPGDDLGASPVVVRQRAPIPQDELREAAFGPPRFRGTRSCPVANRLLYMWHVVAAEHIESCCEELPDIPVKSTEALVVLGALLFDAHFLGHEVNWKELDGPLSGGDPDGSAESSGSGPWTSRSWASFLINYHESKTTAIAELLRRVLRILPVHGPADQTLLHGDDRDELQRVLREKLKSLRRKLTPPCLEAFDLFLRVDHRRPSERRWVVGGPMTLSESEFEDDQRREKRARQWKFETVQRHLRTVRSEIVSCCGIKPNQSQDSVPRSAVLPSGLRLGDLDE